MSLKVVHAIFISMSLLLGVFVMTWTWTAYRYYQNTGYLLALLCVLVLEAGLLLYLRQYIRKVRSW